MRHLTAEVGIRQFLDIGSGIPANDNVHEVAQEIAPESRVVYVDYDPIVLAHSHQLLRSSPEGVTTYLQEDMRNPERVIEQAAATLDFTRPVALLLVAILHFFPDEHRPRRHRPAPGRRPALRQPRGRVAPGARRARPRRHLRPA